MFVHIIANQESKSYLILINYSIRMFKKNCVFSHFTATPPSPTRDLQSPQCNASAGEGEVANFREFLGKNTIFNEHPVAL